MGGGSHLGGRRFLVLSIDTFSYSAVDRVWTELVSSQSVGVLIGW